MIHVDVFAGIGGHSLAARDLGIPTIGVCEIDPWCRRVLAKNFPEAKQHDDIKTLTGDIVRGWSGGRSIGLLTSSWPCQPFSVAGQRRGREDDRHLWPEVARLVAEIRPRFLLGENVPGIISMELDAVLADLESLGYACRAVVLPAGAVNALHRRDRVWILANAWGAEQQDIHARESHAGGSSPVVADPERGGRREPMRVDAEGEPFLAAVGAESASRVGSSGQDGPVAHPPTRGIRRGRAPGDTGQPAQCGQGPVGVGIDTDRAGREERRRRQPAGHEALCGVDAGPPRISAGLVRRPAAGLPWSEVIRQRWADGTWEDGLPRVVATEADRRNKLKAAGNAVVPPLVYEILRVMLADQLEKQL